MILSFNDVNKRGTVTWSRCNDDSKSSIFRKKFTDTHGGEFTRIGKYWEWNPSASQMIDLDSKPSETPVQVFKTEAKSWIFLTPDKKVIKTQNIQEFCNINKLTRSSVYEVISGKRKQHKGYTFVMTIN